MIKLSWRYILDQPGRAFVNILIIGLSIGLTAFVFRLKDQYDKNIQRNIEGIDLVVGAKGSPLQIILANVYHADEPTGNIPLDEVRKIERHPFVKKAIHLAYGDSYAGFRILGTTHSYAEHYHGELKTGSWWKNNFEVTIGSAVAKSTGLNVGDHFYGMHGEVQGGHVHEDSHYMVKGIMEPSGTVIDNLILTNIGSVWEAHDESDEHDHDEHDHHEHDEGHHEEHDHREHDEGHHEEHDHPEHDEGHHEEHERHEHYDDHHDEHKHPNQDAEHQDHDPNDQEPVDSQEITAVLFKLKGVAALVEFPNLVDQVTSMKAAKPAIEIHRLNERFGTGQQLISGVALLLLFISALSIFFSLGQGIRERLTDLAIIRTLGGTKSQLFLVVLFESWLTGVAGWITGWLISKTLIFLSSHVLYDEFHFDLNAGTWNGTEFALLWVVLGVTTLAALVPGIKASRTDIGVTLQK